MSVFKCKMCGGTIEFEQGASVGVCDSCGTRQTLPRLDDDRKANLYDRANHFRRNNDFDKAMGIYEQILNEDSTDAETYWSLVLCRYGIEYVEDPATHKRVPTVNRTQFTSIFADEDYKSALQYADGYQKAIYEEEARAIDEIQRGILEISQKEEPFDVFISYKETDESGRRTRDSVLANDLYHQLTQEGFKVFFSRITLEDKLGTAYEPYIFAALNSAKVMVVLGTKPEYFRAVWMKNEWSRYLALIKNGAKKTLIPAYRDMDPYDLPEEFSHLQAQDMSKLGFMQDLIRGIKKIIGTDEQKAAAKETAAVQQVGGVNIDALLKRGNMALEDGEWDQAANFFDEVLNQDAECAKAYFGLSMAEAKTKTKEAFTQYYIRTNVYKRDVQGRPNLRRARKYADSELSEYFCELDETLSEKKKQLLEQQKRQEELYAEQVKIQQAIPNLISTGFYYTVGLKADGTVVATGLNKDDQLDVSGWTEINAVAAGSHHTVGLKADGTVTAVGNNEHGQCNVSRWTDIVAVAAGVFHTVGLKADGTVIAVGDNEDGQCNVSGWTDIVAISTQAFHTVGLKADGTVVATGLNEHGQCKVYDWKNIVKIAAGKWHTVGLKADGTVITAGDNKHGQCNVSDWRYIVAVSASDYHTVGLKADGTVIAVGLNNDGQCSVSDWRDVVAISAGYSHTVGLKADGTVVAVGISYGGPCNVSDWRLFQSIHTIEQEQETARAEAMRRRKEKEARQKQEQQMREARKEQGRCQYCGGGFKGLLIKKCVSCGRTKDY